MNVEEIRAAAIQRGRAERRAQGIPAEIESPEMTAKLAGLLNGGTPPNAAQSKAGFLGPQHDNHSAGC